MGNFNEIWKIKGDTLTTSGNGIGRNNNFDSSRRDSV